MNRSLAPCAAIRQSQAIARSIAPPTACPLSSAIVGTGSVAIRSQAAVPRAVTSDPGRPRTAFRSAPDEKIRGPDPVIAIIRTSSSAASRSAASASASSVSSDNAFSSLAPVSTSTPSAPRTSASTAVGPGGSARPSATSSSAFDILR